MFESKVYEAIRAAYLADQEDPKRNRRCIDIPSVEIISELVDVCFKASLKTEELRPVSYSIALVPQEGEQRKTALSGTSHTLLEFEHSSEFSADSIAKLSPACDPSISSFLVSYNKPSQFRIWGSVFFRGDSGRFFSSGMGVEGLMSNRPDVLTVVCKSVGSLVLARGGARIGHFVSGSFEKSNPTSLIAGEFGSEIRRRLQRNLLFEKHGNPFWWLYRDSIAQILLELDKRTSGGAIVVLDGPLDAKHEQLVEPRFRYQGLLGMSRLYSMILDNSPRLRNNMSIEALEALIHTDFEYHRLLSERLAFVAQLASTDGAVITDQYLEPLAFGAKLLTPLYDGKVLKGNGTEDFNLHSYGTRHRSAAGFVAEVPNAFAFVRSSDGPIRGFAVDEDSQLRCWPDCMQSVFM